LQNQKKINGDYMSKKRNSKKNSKNDDFLDVSYRIKMDVDEDQRYSDEDLSVLIIELNKQLQELNAQHEKLYSSNAYIDRICQRTFRDILHAKIISIWENIINKKKHKIIEKG